MAICFEDWSLPSILEDASAAGIGARFPRGHSTKLPHTGQENRRLVLGKKGGLSHEKAGEHAYSQPITAKVFPWGRHIADAGSDTHQKSRGDRAKRAANI
jgi:hypothetical protein